LRRALGNLIENAVKYGRDDSQITIGVAELQGRLMLSVHNYGEPIPPEALPHLFVAFQRRAADKTAKPGWGLGLMHVQAIAQAHGGSVTVESSDERGTTFTIDILVDPREWLASRKSRR
jgi:signal transduction histidine kinase